MSSTRVYIGHLPYKAREGDVENFFIRYGRIREILLKNGFGFVEFDDPRDAEEAVYRCNGKELRGERVVVEMTKRPPKGRDMYRTGGYGGGGGRYSSGPYGGRPSYYRSPPRRRDEYGPSQTKYRVIVENLSSRISWQDLKDVMRAAGEVTYADAHRIRKNEGIVCFSSSADLRKALDTLDGKELNGRKIRLIDASRDSRRSRSVSRSRSRSDSRSSRSRTRSRSDSKSSKSRSRSRLRSSEKSRSISGSRSSRSASPGKTDNSKRITKSKSVSPDDKSRSETPEENGDIDD